MTRFTIHLTNPLAFILAALLYCTTAHSQLGATQAEQKLTRYNSNVLQEKLYMHVDRSFYLAGEILWCKVYVVDALLHQPLDVSKVAYIELLDENNTPALQAKIGLDKGRGLGSLSMPLTLKSGNYKLRAYTSWMKNADPGFFFEKQLTVVNTQKSREQGAAFSQTKTPDIRFFPEGGNLVNGLHSRVACKVVGTDGKGLDFTATIVDENNKTITSFGSLKFGMGNFMFTPEKGHSYQAIVQTAGEKYTQALPFVFEKGYVMQLSGGQGKPITIQVQTNAADAGKVLLLVHTRQSVKAALQADVQQGKTSFTIDETQLGEGISQFTLLNTEGRPLCERLYFTYPSHELVIDIKGGEKTYETRSKIDLKVETKGSGDTGAADLSVAVYKLDDLQGVDAGNIQTYLWLSSDLKGHIESPGYYFSKENADAALAMDNLMLTQGWRRFNWEDVLKENDPPLKYPAEHSGHIITGKVLHSITGKPMENVEVYVSVPGANGNTKVAMSDASGNFKLDFKSFRGTAEMILQTDPQTDSLARIEVNNPYSDQYSETKLPPFRLSSIHEKTLAERSMGVRVQQVFTGPELKQFVNPYDTTTGFHQPDASYMVDDYTRFTTMEEIMREYVGSMGVRGDRNTFTLRLIENTSMPMNGMAHTDFFPTQPLILVDGVPLFNTDKLMKFDPLKMRKVEVYNKRFVMGKSSFAGILNWTTYKGNLTDIELDPRALVIDYEALQLTREFYSPVYDANHAQDNMPDYRTLLYWAYEIAPETNGERHVRFYSSDKKGKYIAVIEGLNAAGQCGSAQYLFEVK